VSDKGDVTECWICARRAKTWTAVKGGNKTDDGLDLVDLCKGEAKMEVERNKKRDEVLCTEENP